MRIPSLPPSHPRPLPSQPLLLLLMSGFVSPHHELSLSSQLRSTVESVVVLSLLRRYDTGGRYATIIVVPVIIHHHNHITEQSSGSVHQFGGGGSKLRMIATCTIPWNGRPAALIEDKEECLLIVPSQLQLPLPKSAR